MLGLKLAIISFAFAFISFTANLLFRKNIKAWTFWQSTGYVSGVAILAFAIAVRKERAVKSLMFTSVLPKLLFEKERREKT